MSQFNIAEAKARFSELVQKALLGEEVVIARDNKPLLRLIPVNPALTERRPGSAKGQGDQPTKGQDSSGPSKDAVRPAPRKAVSRLPELPPMPSIRRAAVSALC